MRKEKQKEVPDQVLYGTNMGIEPTQAEIVRAYKPKSRYNLSFFGNKISYYGMITSAIIFIVGTFFVPLTPEYLWITGGWYKAVYYVGLANYALGSALLCYLFWRFVFK